MSTAVLPAPHETTTPTSSAWWFCAIAVGLACAACLLAGWAPIGFSIVTVFLLAGPHNWMEGRYLLTRMPGRWGALRAYFLTGIFGTVALTAASAVLTWVVAYQADGEEVLLTGLAIWNTALIGWVLGLI